MSAERPTGIDVPHPFDHERPDERDDVPEGDHPLIEGKTVHFSDRTEPNHAPDTTAARSKHSHGRLRRAFDRHFPPGTKRRTAAAGAPIVIGGAVGLNGGAEQTGQIAEHIEHATPGIVKDVAEFAVPGEPKADNDQERSNVADYGTTEVSQGNVEGSVGDTRADQAGLSEVPETPAPEPAPVTSSEAPAENAPIASAETPEPAPETGGLPAEDTPDTGGIGASSSSN